MNGAQVFDDDTTPPLQTAMILFYPLCLGMRDALESDPFSRLEQAFNGCCQRRLVVLDHQGVVTVLANNSGGNGFWQPMASMVTRQPFSRRASNSSGIAVISLDFSPVLIWPNVTPS